jgi:hypothetical protein
MNNTVLPFPSKFDNIEESGFECFDNPGPAPPFHLSIVAEIGLALGLGLPVLALFYSFGKCIWKRRAAKRNRREGTRRQTPAYVMVDLERERDEQNEDMPPTYEYALTAEGSGAESSICDETTEELLLSKYRPWN